MPITDTSKKVRKITVGSEVMELSKEDLTEPLTQQGELLDELESSINSLPNIDTTGFFEIELPDVYNQQTDGIGRFIIPSVFTSSAGKVFVYGDKGVYVLNNNTKEWTKLSSVLSDSSSNGIIWYETEDGQIYGGKLNSKLIKYDESTNSLIDTGLYSVNMFHEDKENKLLYCCGGSRSGIINLTDSSLIVSFLNWPYFYIIEPTKLLLGTNTSSGGVGGVAYYDGMTVTKIDGTSGSYAISSYGNGVAKLSNTKYIVSKQISGGNTYLIDLETLTGEVVFDSYMYLGTTSLGKVIGGCSDSTNKGIYYYDEVNKSFVQLSTAQIYDAQYYTLNTGELFMYSTRSTPMYPRIITADGLSIVATASSAPYATNIYETDTLVLYIGPYASSTSNRGLYGYNKITKTFKQYIDGVYSNVYDGVCYIDNNKLYMYSSSTMSVYKYDSDNDEFNRVNTDLVIKSNVGKYYITKGNPLLESSVYSRQPSAISRNGKTQFLKGAYQTIKSVSDKLGIASGDLNAKYITVVNGE